MKRVQEGRTRRCSAAAQSSCGGCWCVRIVHVYVCGVSCAIQRVWGELFFTRGGGLDLVDIGRGGGDSLICCRSAR